MLSPNTKFYRNPSSSLGVPRDRHGTYYALCIYSTYVLCAENIRKHIFISAVSLLPL